MIQKSLKIKSILNLFKRFHSSLPIVLTKWNGIDDKTIHFYQETFDISVERLVRIRDKYPRIDINDTDHISEVLKVLEGFDIDKYHAIEQPAVFISHAKSTRMHGRTLLECGFERITPKYLINYNALVKKSTIIQLKQRKYLPKNLIVYDKLYKYFPDFDATGCDLDSSSFNTLYKTRLSIMQSYLEQKLEINRQDFDRIVRIHYQFRHRPLADVRESLRIASEELGFPKKKIVSYPILICADPANTRKILQELPDLNGIGTREALYTYPGILKINYETLLRIKNILQDNKFSIDSQRRALIMYTLKPETVVKRIEEMKNNKLYTTLSSCKRSLLLLLYKNRAIRRFEEIKNTNRRCTQIDMLLAANNTFDSYMKKFRDKNNRDEVVSIILHKLLSSKNSTSDVSTSPASVLRRNLSKHCFCDYVSIFSITDCIDMLLSDFHAEDILQNIHIVLYSKDVIKEYARAIKELQSPYSVEKSPRVVKTNDGQLDDLYSAPARIMARLMETSVDLSRLSNGQILALILYFIEKEHFFTGDGIWNNSHNMK